MIYSNRAIWQDLAASLGGIVDVASYAGQYSAAAAPAKNLAIKPDSRRGPFVACSLQVRSSTTIPASRLSMTVGMTRQITLRPTYRDALAHNSANLTQGTIFSMWPAPVYIPIEGNLALQEETLISTDSLASLCYLVSGFHTDAATYLKLVDRLRELRTFAFDVQPDSTVAGGNADGGYRLDETMELTEYVATNNDVSAGVLDFVRGTLTSSQFIFAQRQAGSAALLLPTLLGVPSAYIGRPATRGDVVTVTERVSSGARLDVWSFMGIAGCAA